MSSLLAKWLVALAAPALTCSALAGIDAFDWSRADRAGICQSAFSASFDAVADRITWSFNLGAADAQLGSYAASFDITVLDDVRAWPGADPQRDSSRQDTFQMLRLVRAGGNVLGDLREPSAPSWLTTTTSRAGSGSPHGITDERVGHYVAATRPMVPAPGALTLLGIAALSPRRRRKN